MTRATNARIAGVTLLLYIGIGVAQMVMGRGIVRSAGTARMLTSMAEHADVVRLNALLGFLTAFIAILLGVALYGLTRHEDHELSMLALLCRGAEGVIGSLPAAASLTLLWIGIESHGTPPLFVVSAADLLLRLKAMLPLIGATFFSVGSLVFSCLLLRGRLVPRPLAMLGVVASALLSVTLPLQLVGSLAGPLTQCMWAPMAVFEVVLAVWLLVRGAEAPLRTEARAPAAMV